MKGKTRLLSFFLALMMTLSVIPFSNIPSFAIDNEEERVDSMVDIEASLSSYRIGEIQSYTDDGYIGIPIEVSVYYDSSKEAASPGYMLDATPVILYVVNTCAVRTGTASDVSIISDMLSNGYIVLVIDYLNNEKAVSPELDWSAQGLIKSVRAGDYFKDKTLFPSGNYYNTYVVPSGHTVLLNQVFFEMDKHGADGTLDRIVHSWNNDFRSSSGTKNLMVKWVRPSGEQKPTQEGWDGTAVQWYSDIEGKNAVDASDPNAMYVKVKHTKAEVITDCVKPDGSPIDLKLYMSFVYPVEPESEVPVFVLSSSSGHLASAWSNPTRPHYFGFGFDGYASVAFDYGYVPMCRDDHYGYFEGKASAGGVTGDNVSYSVTIWNTQKISTAAMRYIRYLSLSDHAKYKFDTEHIGVSGNSKGSMIDAIGDLSLNTVKSAADFGDDLNALISYADARINSLVSNADYPGHHGESRYQNGKTEDYTVDGFTVHGGQVQPWLTYGNSEIPSGCAFTYSNNGGQPIKIKENHAPMFISLQIGEGETSGYYNQNLTSNLGRIYDIPTVCLVSPLGHAMVDRQEVYYGVDAYKVFKDFANFVLNNGAVSVAYVTPENNHMNVSTTDGITVKFAGIVSEEEIQKVVISDGVSNASGRWEASFGNTEWTFYPDALKGGTKYTVTVPANLKGTNGVEMGSSYTSVFTTEAEAVISAISGGVATITNENGTYVSFTAPDMSAYTDINANLFNLRLRVANDAANALKVYAVSSESATSGTELGTAYLRGDGYYDIDISSYMCNVSAGKTVYFLIKATKAAANDALIFSESFESSVGSFKKSNYASIEQGTAPDGTSALKVVVGLNNGQFNYDQLYYSNTSTAFTCTKNLFERKLTRSDYGRKITVTARVYDTISRDLTMLMSSRSNPSLGVIDRQLARANYTTKAGQWQTLTLEYTVYDTDYGRIGLENQSFSVAMSSGGNNESAIYFDSIEITEDVTEVELSEATLALGNAGSQPYKAAESANAFDVNGTEYSTLYQALKNYTSGQTVKLLRNYNFGDGDVYDISAFAEVNIDLNGYRILCNNTSKSLIYVSTANATNVTVTLKNGAVLLADNALIRFENAAGNTSGKQIDVNVENVYIGLKQRAMTASLISDFNAQSADVLVDGNITLTDCFIDVDNSHRALNNIAVIGKGNSTIAINTKVLGGNIRISSFLKTALCSDSQFLTFDKNASNEYTKLILPNSEAVTEDSYKVGELSGKFVLTSGVLDESGYTSYDLTVASQSTQYGIIPEEYVDTEAYPFAVFKNGEFVGAYPYWADKASGVDSAIEAAYANLADGVEVTILLRRDYATSKYNTSDNDDTYDNLGQKLGTLTVDLNGYTLTAGRNKPLMILQAKSSYGASTLNVSFKNGTLEAKANPLFQIGAYSGDGQRTINLTLTDVTMRRASGAWSQVLAGMIAYVDSASVALKSNIVLNNCEIDLKTYAPSTALTLFKLAGNSNYNTAVTVNGGKILVDNMDNVVLYTGDTEDSFSFGNGTTELHIAKGTAPTEEFATANGNKVFTETTTAGVYTLGALFESTPYGNIPLEYDAQTYPFAVFKDGEFVGAYPYWADKASGVDSAIEAAYANLADGVEVTILLRRDYATSKYNTSDNDDTYDNLGQKLGTLNVDLNGYTLTAGRNKPLMILQAKSSYGASTFNVSFKNGTLEAKANQLFQIGAFSGDGQRTINLTLTDVKITRASGAWSQVLAGMIAYVDSASVALKSNIVLNNCEIDLKTYAPSTALTLFKLAGNSNYNTAVTVNGGKILVDNMDNVVLYTGDTEDSFSFGNGTTELHIAKGTAPTEEFATANGNKVFTESATAGVYTLTEAKGDIETDGGVSFGDIQDALDNAESGSTLTLNKDITAGSLSVSGDVTIDLSGKVLDIDELTAGGTVTFVDSGSGTKGLIKTEKGNLNIGELVTDDTMLVYNASRGGYEVTEVINQNRYTPSAETNGFEIVFRPSFGTSTEYNQTIFGAGGQEADISVTVNLEDASGNIIMSHTFDDSLIEQAYSQKLALRLTVSDISTNETVYIKCVMLSGTGQSCVMDLGTYTPAN